MTLFKTAYHLMIGSVPCWCGLQFYNPFLSRLFWYQPVVYVWVPHEALRFEIPDQNIVFLISNSIHADPSGRAV